jgi:hypothetical protein
MTWISFLEVLEKRSRFSFGQKLTHIYQPEIALHQNFKLDYQLTVTIRKPSVLGRGHDRAVGCALAAKNTKLRIS